MDVVKRVTESYGQTSLVTLACLKYVKLWHEWFMRPNLSLEISTFLFLAQIANDICKNYDFSKMTEPNFCLNYIIASRMNVLV